MAFDGTTTAQLQTIHDALITQMSSGVRAYSVEGRSVTRVDAIAYLKEISNELGRRARGETDESNGLDLGLVEFGEA